ncbi:glycerophosphodiester phosphodiesterase [Candidatus Poribacteria bacterium]|nr:MAG: glycerophosphodiester phosphodiesterase [Candidatus Poribacteria bacterium]
MVANVAHRGASGNYPENTLIAFQKALEIGVDEIELDLYMTKDDHLIIMHDSTVDRTTDGTGAISDLTLVEIKALDAGVVFGERFRGEHVPTWEEALELVQGKVGLNVHLKEGGNPDGHYERKVAKALSDFHMVDDSILTCSDASVGIFAEIDSRIECRIFRANRTPEEYIRKSVEMGLRTMQPGRDITTRDFVQKAHAAGRIVHVFYADTPEDMRAYIEIGVDGILTNYPERLKTVLAESE